MIRMVKKLIKRFVAIMLVASVLEVMRRVRPALNAVHALQNVIRSRS